jgi:signal transduction histidine kinase/transcriptional regulator with XRE-family HTH domain
MYNIEAVATNIRNARLYRKYSQDYLAYKLKISQNAYSKVELGHTRISLERLIIIAEVLEVKLNKLIGISDIHADVEAIGLIPIVPALLDVICQATGMGFAAIARVTEDKWVVCAVRDKIQFGLEPGGELKVETTICNEIRQSGQAVVIDHVDKDEAFWDHHTPAMYGFQSYISIPIINQDGTFFGTLCAIDPKPAKLNNSKTIGMFKLFADLISFHLNSLEQLAINETKLLEERQAAKLREQFIAILGHDLRNPLGAVLCSAQFMLQMSLNEEAKLLANIIEGSCYRMTELIENVLDFARGRLGDGLSLNLNVDEHLDKILNQVITELGMIWPDRVIEKHFALNEPVDCDDRRIAQLFSNLLGNAITHGKKDAPVRVKAISGEGEFILSVSNYGNKIPVAVMDRLFQPFARSEVASNKQGLGLGLYIASEIARAHRGKLDVASTQEETQFTFRMLTKQTEAPPLNIQFS